ncbi:hypothetical protein [Kitasatospora sp. GP82]|uniref:hypothetical protein n=1 Tax=Kitasatospora sp. GP82 TaxID=3035089 RepID=UPI0024736688|nr:hypothetical protein [Kitasatospora sp. GP82]MDH6128022.1 outer membrane biosynthesis protein TonB [Kitasatospora sp. GP82]
MSDRDEGAVARVAGPRHAAPRVKVRSRLRGRAVAIAAVPTALLMGTIPSIAMADVQKDKGCATAADTVLEETPVPKSEITPVPDPKPTSTKAARPSEQPTAQPDSQTQQPAPVSTPTTVPSPTVSATATTHPRPQQAAATTSPTPKADSVGPAGILDDILDPILHLGSHRSPTPTPAPTPKATSAPSPSATPGPPPAKTRVPEAETPAAESPSPSSSPSASDSETASPAPSGSPTATPSSSPSPSASPTKNPNCQVDTRALSAGKAEPNRLVPEQNWTLHSSTLGLYGAKFYGLVDVRTQTTTKRVLKFVVDRVDIGDLDMSTLEGNGMTFHVKGAPGSTSTMRDGEVTMYVERLSGHLSKILGLPLPIDLGEITLTPDTLPQWLYDLIGSVPIPLDLEMKQVTAVQAGQFGGTLSIPGMQMYNDNLPYGQ